MAPEHAGAAPWRAQAAPEQAQNGTFEDLGSSGAGLSDTFERTGGVKQAQQAISCDRTVLSLRIIRFYGVFVRQYGAFAQNHRILRCPREPHAQNHRILRRFSEPHAHNHRILHCFSEPHAQNHRILPCFSKQQAQEAHKRPFRATVRCFSTESSCFTVFQRASKLKAPERVQALAREFRYIYIYIYITASSNA